MSDSTYSAQNQSQPTGKKQDLVTKYLSDMVALEGHIYQAIDKQVKETQDEPDVNPKLVQIRDGLERHTNTLRDRLKALGGQPTSPIKEAGASVLGVAAGVIDKIRSEEIAKNFRDNYTALSLSNISYVMLITTCLACDDTQTAGIAQQCLKENAQFTVDLGSLIPYAVVRDLKDEANLNKSAVEEARKRYAEVWPQNGSKNQGGGQGKTH